MAVALLDLVGRISASFWGSYFMTTVESADDVCDNSTYISTCGDNRQDISLRRG